MLQNWDRRTLTVIMLASGSKLLGASAGWVLVIALSALVAGVVAWGWVRVRHGEAPFVWQERRRVRSRVTSAPRG